MKPIDAEVLAEARRWLACEDSTDGHVCADYLARAIVAADEAVTSKFSVERNLPRDQRQVMITDWAKMAFGGVEATSLPQRGLRLLEEATEAFQACGGDEAIAHKLVAYVFARPPGEIGQELGGVAVTVLALAAAAGLSADEEECREVHRVLSKPLREFTERNANKNAAGLLIQSVAPSPSKINSLEAVKSFGSGFSGRGALAEYLADEDPAKALLAYMRTAVDAFLADSGGPQNAFEGWEVFARWIQQHGKRHARDLKQPAEQVLQRVVVHAEQCLSRNDRERPVTDLRVVEPWIDTFFEMKTS